MKAEQLLQFFTNDKLYKKLLFKLVSGQREALARLVGGDHVTPVYVHWAWNDIDSDIMSGMLDAIGLA